MFLAPALWQSLLLTMELAAVTTGILLVIGLPLAHWLNTSSWRGIVVIETLTTLPIVLPPTVIGFYLLVLFAPQSPLGATWLQITGQTLAFSFPGLVVGSIIYSLPFAVQPFQAALKAIPIVLIESARISGANRWQTFRHVILPMARHGIGVGVTLSFAHTVGEFGLVLMLGGSIPGRTRVASIALYDEVQKLNYPQAHLIAAILLVLAFLLILVMKFFQRSESDGIF